MKRFGLIGFASLVATLALASDALAKGASEATITGPGLAGPISLAGEGQAGGQHLMQLAQDAGFFAAVFEQLPDPMLSERPPGDLGPRYTITYVMRGPTGQADRIRQDLYPYAATPVTYVAPGQRFFGSQQTHGGWYAATRMLKEDLVAVGLPHDPPAGGGGSEFPWTLAAALPGVAALLAVAGLAVLRLRRRPGPATA